MRGKGVFKKLFLIMEPVVIPARRSVIHFQGGDQSGGDTRLSRKWEMMYRPRKQILQEFDY